MKERRKKTKKKTKGSNYGGKEERRGRSEFLYIVLFPCLSVIDIERRFANAAASIGYMTPNLVP